MSYKITYRPMGTGVEREEVVEADSFQDANDWIEFRRFQDMAFVQVLRVRTSDVKRIEEVRPN